MKAPIGRRFGVLLAAAGAVGALALALRPFPAGFWGHDTVWHLVRIAQWHRGVQDGVLYPRFFHDVYWGHGGPVMIFYSPIPYLVTEPFMLLGAGPSRALEMGIAVAFICAAVSIFLLARAPLGAPAALVAAAAYTLAPYHLLNAWVRAAYAEMLAMALLPVLLLTARRAAQKPGAIPVAGLSVAAAGMVLTHLISAVFCLPLAFAYGGWHARLAPRGPRSGFVRVAAGLAAGLLLSAFYWMPAVAERSHTEVSRTFRLAHDPTPHFLWMRQLFDTEWGFGWSVAGPEDGMSFQVGWIHIIGLTVAAAIAWRGPALLRGEMRFWVVASAVAAYLTLRSADWVWRITPALSAVQFPWRLLGPVAVGASLCVAAPVALLAERPGGARAVIGSAIILLALLASYAPYTLAQPRRYLDETFTPETLSRSMGTERAWMPKGANPEDGPQGRLAVIVGEARVEVTDDRTHVLAARVWSAAPVSLRARILDYPGWRASVDGAAAATRRDATGALVVDVPAGDHVLRLRFGSTPLRSAAACASAATLIALAAALGLSLRKRT